MSTPVDKTFRALQQRFSMTALQALAARKRNAINTRAALLAAAMERFTREGYDSVSLREIASDVGVDVSLVSRYFGGKDELFADVLAACPSSTDIFEGDVATFGERLATKLVDDAAEDEDLTCLLIILRSASSPKAREAIRKSGEERFFGPIEEWLGGPDSKVRARLIADIVMGVMIDRVISDNFELGVEERKRFRDRLVRVIQGAIEI